jgi:hypothetical protein
MFNNQALTYKYNLAALQSVTRIMYPVALVNLVTPKAGAKDKFFIQQTIIISSFVECLNLT